MNKEEREKYLDSWGSKCLLCQQEIERKDKHLVEAIVPLHDLPDHAAGPVTKFYMVCSSCLKDGVLI